MKKRLSLLNSDEFEPKWSSSEIPPQPINLLIMAEQLAELPHALEVLPERSRTALHAYYFPGHPTPQEVAALWGCTVQNVAYQKSQAIRFLRRHFGVRDEKCRD